MKKLLLILVLGMMTMVAIAEDKAVADSFSKNENVANVAGAENKPNDCPQDPGVVEANRARAKEVVTETPPVKVEEKVDLNK